MVEWTGQVEGWWKSGRGKGGEVEGRVKGCSEGVADWIGGVKLRG